MEGLRHLGRAWPGAEPNAHLWATADETREEIVGLYHRAWAHADATIAALPLDAVGHVPWWPPGNEVTLHRILVHVVTETHRHAGHADIVREAVDGATAFPLMAALEGWPETPWMKPWRPAS